METKTSEKSIKIKRKIFIDSFVLFLIAISPFIFKLHEYLPRTAGETFNFMGLTIDSNGFADVSTYGWFLVGKLVPFYLLMIWFFTCKQWWYHIIIIPIMMYAFQIFEVVYSDDFYVDTENMLWLLPVCMIVIPFVYFIRIKLYDKYVHGIDLEAMEEELEILKAKRDSNKQTDYNTSKQPGAFKQIILDIKNEVINIASLCKEGVQELFNMKG